MARKILFLVNPISGVRSKVHLEELISTQCKHRQVGCEIMHTNKEGDYNYLPQKVKNENFSDVVICGGDGTVRTIVSHLLQSAVNIGIIPLGSGNGLARTASIPYSIPKALEIIFRGQPRFVDAFLVNGILGCQIVGLGFDAFIAAEFARERKRGLSTYTKLAIKHFFKARTYDFTVEWDDEQFPIKAFIFCISNANQFGNNLKIAPQALLNDGRLDVVVLKKTSKLRILSSFVNHLLFAKKITPEQLEKNKGQIAYFNISKIRIINEQMAPVHIDGDPMPSEPEYTIEVLPNAYKLIQPV